MQIPGDESMNLRVSCRDELEQGLAVTRQIQAVAAVGWAAQSPAGGPHVT